MSRGWAGAGRRKGKRKCWKASHLGRVQCCWQISRARHRWCTSDGLKQQQQQRRHQQPRQQAQVQQPSAPGTSRIGPVVAARRPSCGKAQKARERERECVRREQQQCRHEQSHNKTLRQQCSCDLDQAVPVIVTIVAQQNPGSPLVRDDARSSHKGRATAAEQVSSLASGWGIGNQQFAARRDPTNPGAVPLFASDGPIQMLVELARPRHVAHARGRVSGSPAAPATR